MTSESLSVAALKESYDVADRFTREVAQFRAAIAVPANNELRYAGHHLLQSLDGDVEASRPDELRKARNHCQRAMYDAAEAGIIFAIDEIARFQNDYKGVVVSRVIQEYPEIRRLAIGAQELLAQGRAGRASEQQQAAEYMALFRKLRDAVHLLQGSRDDLNAMIEEGRAKEQTESRRFLVQIASRVLAALIALIGLIWTIRQTLPSE